MRTIAAGVVAAALASLPCHADVLSFQRGNLPTSGYQGARAVSISAGSSEPWKADANYGSGEVWVGGLPIKQAALLRWDVSSIPAAASVTAVSITVRAIGSNDWQFPIFQCLRPWSESQATWQQYAAGSAWASAGALSVGVDRGAVVLGTLQGSDGASTVSLNAAGVAVVQGWVNGTGVNNGFVVQDYARRGALHWPHAGAAVPSQRPRLQVSYSNGAGFTANFQNGVAPTAGYAGSSDATIADGPDPRAANRNQAGLSLGGGPLSAGTLISFDVTAIPTTATVSAVRLELEAHRGGPDAYPIFQMLRPWVDTTATWLTSDGTTPWAAPGAAGTADRASAVLGLVATADKGGVQLDLNPAGVAVVQGWVAAPSTNRGLLIADYSKSAPLLFDDDEGDNEGKRPALVVTFSSGGAPVAVLTPSTQEVDPGAVVLDGAGSTPGPTGTLVAHHWSQPEGPTGVELAAGTKQQLTLTEPGDYAFRLQVEDSLGVRSAPVTARVKVRGAVFVPKSVGCGCTAGGPPMLLLLGLLLWLRGSRRA